MAKRTTKAAAAEETRVDRDFDPTEDHRLEAEDKRPALPPDSEIQTIINEETGETRQIVARAGYAPVPMPFGFRLARNEEIPG